MRLSDQDSAKDVSQEATKDASRDSEKDVLQDSAKDAARDSAKDASQDFRIGRNARNKITTAKAGHFKNFFIC